MLNSGASETDQCVLQQSHDTSSVSFEGTHVAFEAPDDITGNAYCVLQQRHDTSSV